MFNTLNPESLILNPEKKKEPKETTPRPAKKKDTGSTFVPPSWVDQQLWTDFMAMRKAIKRPATDRAQELLVMELHKLVNAGYDQKDVIENSIRNNWQDLFAPKNKTVNGSNGGFVC